MKIVFIHLEKINMAQTAVEILSRDRPLLKKKIKKISERWRKEKRTTGEITNKDVKAEPLSRRLSHHRITQDCIH